MHVAAKLRAVANAEGEIAGELFHFSDGVGPFGVDQIPKIGGEQAIAIQFGGLVE